MVVACDSFKGCLSSREIALTVAEAIQEIDPTITVDAVPVADGGEGTVEALVAACDQPVQWVSCMVDAPLQQLPQVEAHYAIDADGHTAYMEMAQANGLTLVPMEQRDIMHANSLGTGLMMLDAVERGCTHIVMGLGGSATCDGGMGVLAALGLEFLDNQSHLLYPCADNLNKIFEIDCHGLRDDVFRTRITLVTDVDNPLCGPRGAARVFAPQKGASPQQVEQLELGMAHYASIIGNSAHNPGAGAAGGIAAGLTAFLPHCNIVHGAHYILGKIRLANRIADADLVITGEGRIDGSTSMGKTPQAVAIIARKCGVPVVALCGDVAANTNTSVLGFDRIITITPPDTPLAEALRPDVARINLQRATSQLLHDFHHSHASSPRT